MLEMTADIRCLAAETDGRVPIDVANDVDCEPIELDAFFRAIAELAVGGLLNQLVLFQRAASLAVRLCGQAEMGAAYLRKSRRFWPALTADAQGRSLGYRLERSNDGGLTWRQYVYGFDNLLDECGVWLSSDRLDAETWVAAQRHNLKFRLTASVVSDERLAAIVADGPVGSMAPVVDHVLTLPRRFRYRRVSAQSLFTSAVRSGTSVADEVDDSAVLYDFVRRTTAAATPVFERTAVQTPSLMGHFQPGDRVTSGPDSRDLLACRRDVRSLLWIERVRLDFTRQRTELRLARSRF